MGAKARRAAVEGSLQADDRPGEPRRANGNRDRIEMLELAQGFAIPYSCAPPAK
jgi:hypothetical protein